MIYVGAANGEIANEPWDVVTMSSLQSSSFCVPLLTFACGRKKIFVDALPFDLFGFLLSASAILGAVDLILWSFSGLIPSTIYCGAAVCIFFGKIASFGLTRDTQIRLTRHQKPTRGTGAISVFPKSQAACGSALTFGNEL